MHLFITFSRVSEHFLVGTTAKTQWYLRRCYFTEIFIFVCSSLPVQVALDLFSITCISYLSGSSASLTRYWTLMLTQAFCIFNLSGCSALALKKLQLPLQECSFAEIVKLEWILEGVPGKGVLSSKNFYILCE